MNHHIRLLIYTIFLLPAAVFAKAETKNIVYMDMRPLLNEDHHDSISVLDVLGQAPHREHPARHRQSPKAAVLH